ncbi:polysaccharide biosynthesis protein [Methanobacterium lacus]|uniref:Polysaccharide biosynthesis protein n=1 Tax=Methanobacterium lacus (strain AL-21) TaxID=877455 RepID=F0TAU8_METLA|nr:oligosaccharide flippase family protein [Methanobacterium lacus]ADZ08974.1 polysaccharide biosynthesis protein [Methanobacterium lacus]
MYKLFVKRIGLIGITNFLVAMNTIILIPILTKNFSAIDYGIWVQVITTFYLVTSVANLGFPYTLIRFVSAEKEKSKIQNTFYTMAVFILIFSLFISTLIFIFSNVIASLLFSGQVLIVKILSFLIFFGTLNSLLIDFFVARSKMKRYSILLLFQTYLMLSLVSFFAVCGYGIILATVGFLISQIIFFIVMTILVYQEIGFKIPEFSKIKEYINFSIPIIPNNVSTWIVESSDRYVIAIMLGTTFLAYYSPGYTIGMALLLFFTPISIILSSILPKYYENGQMEEVMMFINYSLKYFLLIAIPALFILSLLSKPILMILTTPEIALNGYLVTPFVALSAILFGIYGIIMNLIVLEKKTKIVGSIWTIAALISLLNIIFVPIFGILAAAGITLFSYSTAFLISIGYSKKFFRFYFDYTFIFKSIFASVIISILIVLINPIGFYSLLIMIPLLILIYLIIILLLKCVTNKEINFIKEIFKE